MQSFGRALVYLGVFAIILNFFNFVPKLLVWIYQWGEGPAWGIKIGLIIVGGILWQLGRQQAARAAVHDEGEE
ncbi:hypothetical protein [Neisseria shayeganii]|nr:hypothetical protein [Neisseria shayeganii]QMT39941.1 hypothetical protein H3L94_08765 [Neisseria shayeganii]